MSEFTVFSVIDGESFVDYKTTGSGNPRLFEGDGLYIYGLVGSLLVTRDGFASDPEEIVPPFLTYIKAMTQTAGQDAVGGILEDVYSSITVLFGMLSTTSGSTVYQLTPEVYHAWKGGQLLPTNFRPSDATCDDLGNIPVLVGNAHVGTEARVMRSSPNAIPFTMIESDSGLPQTGATSGITDIECAAA